MLVPCTPVYPILRLWQPLLCPGNHKLDFLLIVYVWMFSVLVYLCTTYMPGACRGHQISWTGVTEGCKLSHVHWEINPCPLQE